VGLGLAIAKEIVQAHGGAMRLESQEGQGTTFFFTVPQEATKQEVHA
jgi:signal transduction histidine kinase